MQRLRQGETWGRKRLLMSNILILADLTSPLMKPRIRMLKDLPYKKYILHNANNIILNDEQKSGLEDFIILEHRQIDSIRLRYLYSFFYTLFLLLRLNPKLIVVHWASRLYQNILLALWGKRVIVHTMGGDIDSTQDCKGKKRFFIVMLLRQCRIVTTKSDYMSRMLQALQIPLENDKIKQISWGVEERFFVGDSSTESQKLSLQEQLFGRTFDVLFFSIRAFTPFYHSKEILESFLKIFANSPHVALLVSTMRKDAKYFDAYALNLPNLFYCEIAPSAIHRYLFASDVVVSYSQSDGLSQSLLEAVAARRLVVANDLPQHREILRNGYNAVLFENETDLPNALKKAQQLCAQPIVLEKNVDFILNIQSQKDYYLQILKEAFDV